MRRNNDKFRLNYSGVINFKLYTQKMHKIILYITDVFSEMNPDSIKIT